MKLPFQFDRERWRGPTILITLAVLAIVAALLAPEDRADDGGLTTYSAEPSGARVAYELARHMGWQVSRRDRLLDSVEAPSVQVVIGAEQPLGAREVHRLLDNVRQGGGLIFTIDDEEIGDSLGAGAEGWSPMTAPDSLCRGQKSANLAALSDRAFPPMVRMITWAKTPPAQVATLSSAGYHAPSRDTTEAPRDWPAAVGFPLGRGRVALAGGARMFANSAMWTCGWGADVAVARMFEYVRGGAPGLPLVFDEYHHGRGARPGSLTAVGMYLSHTGSGRFLATLVAAGVLLLLAASPRPIIPTEPERMVRRSPLEHAEALGQAYLDVTATRTATDRLVSGLRRRTERVVPSARGGDQRAFLQAIVRHTPSLAPQVGLLERGLSDQIAPREFAHLADALGEIERALLKSPSTPA